MSRILLVFLATSLMTSSVAFANTTDPMTGKNLLEYCQVALDILDNNLGRVQTESEYTQGSKAGKCQGYLMSVNELHELSAYYPQTFRKVDKYYLYCLPESNNMLTNIAAVVKYLKDHPQQLNWQASLLVLRAYETYYPCRQQRG